MCKLRRAPTDLDTHATDGYALREVGFELAHNWLAGLVLVLWQPDGEPIIVGHLFLDTPDAYTKNLELPSETCLHIGRNNWLQLTHQVPHAHCSALAAH